MLILTEKISVKNFQGADYLGLVGFCRYKGVYLETRGGGC